MEKIRTLRGVLNAGLLFLLITNVSFASDRIEPSRNLSRTAESAGKLSVFSEPPELDVKIDGTDIGKTPVVAQKVEPGNHVLRVKDAETKIYVAPDQDLRLSLYKGSFIEIPAEAKQVRRQKNPVEVQTPEKPDAEESAKKKEELLPLYWPLDPRGPIY